MCPSSPQEPPTKDVSPPAWDGRTLVDPHERSDKADRVRRMFTSIAGSYDLNNRVHSFMSGDGSGRPQGVLIATEAGQVTAHAVEQLHDRGVLFVKPGDKVYAGQVVGEHNRDNDIPVNIIRLKALTNIRSANKEATVTLKAPRNLSLEDALEYIEDDELVELTPTSVRLRKRILDEGMRKRAERQKKDREKVGV